MERVIVSLSSIPPRFGAMRRTLETLVEQDFRADRIVLWIPPTYRRFPDWDGELPEVPDGITIMRCDSDLGPATKVLPTLLAFSDPSTTIIFGDDDRRYPRDWLAALVKVARQRPDQCIAASGREIPPALGQPRRGGRLPRSERWTSKTLANDPAAPARTMGALRSFVRTSGYADILEGYCGVVVRPSFFGPEVFDIPPVLWSVDDVWLSGNLERNGIAIWIDKSIPRPRPNDLASSETPLLESVIDGHDRWSADRACIRHFRKTSGIWTPRPLHRARMALSRLKSAFLP